MPNDREAELKKIESKSKAHPTERRDATMTGGEKAETKAEEQNRKHEQSRRREAPIIQRTP
ncbi:MAG TPA: hypothetical protein VHH88_05360 [Verrucomicrobiae bacterium]|nr:hypothetical protein [Verrucomicrobiae bacterium]